MKTPEQLQNHTNPKAGDQYMLALILTILIIVSLFG